jgi:hypothetical protein
MPPEKADGDTRVTAPSQNLPDEELRRLKRIAQARSTSVDRLLDEMSTVLLAESDAKVRPLCCCASCKPSSQTSPMRPEHVSMVPTRERW